MDWTEIILGVLTLAGTIFSTIYTNRRLNMLNAKTRILQLITEDMLRMHCNQMPLNYQNILYDFDEYQKNGGNSYMADKVEEYKREVEAYGNGH